MADVSGLLGRLFHLTYSRFLAKVVWGRARFIHSRNFRQKF